MKQTAIAWLVIGMSLLGCGSHADNHVDIESPGRSIAHVVHGTQGSERWTSTTAIPSAAGFLNVEEVFDLNAQGAMTAGYIRVRDPQGFWNREIWFEPKEGRVIQREGDRTQRFSAPTDSAWIFAPLEGPGARPLVTPISAWITHRATQGNTFVRMIDLAHRRSALVPSEQWSVSTEEGTTVIVGDSGANVDSAFVMTLRDGQTDLMRHVQTAQDTFVFQRSGRSNDTSPRADAQDGSRGGIFHASERAAP